VSWTFPMFANGSFANIEEPFDDCERNGWCMFQAQDAVRMKTLLLEWLILRESFVVASGCNELGACGEFDPVCIATPSASENKTDHLSHGNWILFLKSQMTRGGINLHGWINLRTGNRTMKLNLN
jgi:hypothetical protein